MHERSKLRLRSLPERIVVCTRVFSSAVLGNAVLSDVWRIHSTGGLGDPADGDYANCLGNLASGRDGNCGSVDANCYLSDQNCASGLSSLAGSRDSTR